MSESDITYWTVIACFFLSEEEEREINALTMTKRNKLLMTFFVTMAYHENRVNQGAL